MTQHEENLSAFLDGELSEAEAREIEVALANDDALQAALAVLMNADALAKEEFAAVLDEPVPFSLAAAIQDVSSDVAVNSTRAPSTVSWFTGAVALIALAIGGSVGFISGSSQNTEVVVARGWLDDIADYHGVYSDQLRHLVEVPADEADHIQTWLTASIGSDVRIPDLSEQGLTFQGARLLVAAGKPVAQLMYTDADMRVVALCQIRSEISRDGFSSQNINAFDMVVWGARDADFVIVGDEGREDLEGIALASAAQI